MSVSIAIVHDYVTQRGGAERVVLEMLECWPSAPLHTSLYEPSSSHPEFAQYYVVPSSLSRYSLFRRHHRLAFPLLAATFGRTEIDAEVTICSSSGWAHGVKTTGRKIVYCHAPARWLYNADQYLVGRGAVARMTLKVASQRLRDWDLAAAVSADTYLVNSTAIKYTVASVYGIEAEVLHPPCSFDTDDERQPIGGVPQSFVLSVGRLQPYKNIEAVVEAAALLPQQPFVIAGTGHDEDRLRSMASPNVLFLGAVSDAQLRWLYSEAALLAAASYEDFGLTPVEAATFGVPTVALRYGGFLDTVMDGVTGQLFERATGQDVATAIALAMSTSWDSGLIQAQARKFSPTNFRRRLREIVEDR